MPPLRRHQLRHLSAAGWGQVMAMPWRDEARLCIDHWARHRLPLVVTRQPRGPGRPDGSSTEEIALGLSAPACWGRLRLAVHAPPAALLYAGEFPRAADVVGLLPVEAHLAWQRLCDDLLAREVPVHVFGSYGWQRLTGMAYLRPGSDVDLWLGVRDAAQADAAVVCLRDFDHALSHPRIDGELLFPDGAAVAWREWADARTGRVSSALFKHIDGVALARVPALAAAAVAPSAPVAPVEALP